jgi:hypothetical protein
MGYEDSDEVEQYGNNCNEPWQGEGCGCMDENGDPYESQTTNCCCDYTSQPTENNWQSFGPACCDINAENYGQNAEGIQLNINGAIDTYIMTTNPWYNNPNCDWGNTTPINPNNFGPESFAVFPGSICIGDVTPEPEPVPVPMKEPPKDKDVKKVSDIKPLSESFKRRLQKLANIKK